MGKISQNIQKYLVDLEAYVLKNWEIGPPSLELYFYDFPFIGNFWNTFFQKKAPLTIFYNNYMILN